MAMVSLKQLRYPFKERSKLLPIDAEQGVCLHHITPRDSLLPFAILNPLFLEEFQ